MSYEQQATNVVIVNLIWTLFMVPVGLGNTISTFVGNFIGRNDLLTMQRYIKVMYLLSLTLCLLILSLLWCVKDLVVLLFTRDELSIADLYSVRLWISLFVVFDFIQAVQHGVVRGMGLQ
mmetsp:Transcript_107407/g.231252  ORF Transcript_107407/g.231252 Transcript_107407/m.231252 type:complete len:120 (-) Transcript_107407:723-1082(-)